MKTTLLLIFCTLAVHIQAQTCSCAGTPLTNNLGVGAVATTNWHVQLSYDHHQITDLVSGNETLENGFTKRQTTSTLLQVSRRFKERWQATLIASWVGQEVEASNTLSSSGIGDMIILGQYQFLQSDKTNLFLGGGLKIPIGATQNEENGLLLAPDLQPGTGSWDALGNLIWLQNRIFKDFLDIQTVLTYRKTTATERFNNTQSYRFGDEFLWQSVFSQTFSGKVGLVTPFILTRFRHTRPDERNEQTAFNTGGTWLNLGTGLSWQFTPTVGLQATGMLPVYRHLEGTQLTSSYRLNFALNINLK
ncbi:MAG: hypothetical protein AAF740_05900 [Bacteroidota bacterium]